MLCPHCGKTIKTFKIIKGECKICKQEEWYPADSSRARSSVCYRCWVKQSKKIKKELKI